MRKMILAIALVGVTACASKEPATVDSTATVTTDTAKVTTDSVVTDTTKADTLAQ